MPHLGFEPAFPGSERPQTEVLDVAASYWFPRGITKGTIGVCAVSI